MKTLIIVAHPQLDNSATQQFLKQGATLAQATWHEIGATQSTASAQEQRLLQQAERIIFQFPLYWYTIPAQLKQWQDHYLTTKFIEQKLIGKQLGVVVSTGLPQTAFQAGGRVDFSLDQLLIPLQALAHQAQMTWLPIFPIYQFAYLNEAEQQQLLMDYQRYLSQDQPDSLVKRSQWYLQQLTQLNATATDPLVDLLQEQLNQNLLQLETSSDTLKLIKAGETDNLE